MVFASTNIPLFPGTAMFKREHLPGKAGFNFIYSESNWEMRSR
jgi:hypothetical protein